MAVCVKKVVFDLFLTNFGSFGNLKVDKTHFFHEAWCIFGFLVSCFYHQFVFILYTSATSFLHQKPNENEAKTTPGSTTRLFDVDLGRYPSFP